MASRFIAALTCFCAVNVYFAADFSKGKLRSADECGRREPVTTDEPDKIVGGEDAVHGEFPWMVSLQYASSNSHFCGGAILDNTTIITAAHCVFDESVKTMQVVAGKHKLHHNDGTEQKVGVFKIIIHRYFDSGVAVGAYDIALVKLSSALDLNGKYARPICLPSVHKQEPTGYATVTGWGTLSEDGDVSETLQNVSVLIISDKKCRKYNGKEQVLDHMLCAGYKKGGKDACVGDSGGPLIVDGDDGIATLIGIVSWGYGCAEPKSPGVYTQVSYFIKWISKNMA